jgi:hypothetical protein
MGTYIPTAPNIVYNPGGGEIGVAFPFPADEMVLRRVGSRDLAAATAGGVIVKDEQTAYDLVQIQIKEFALDSETEPFVDQMEALWSHLLKGGACKVTIAPAAGLVLGYLDSFVLAGETAVSVDPTTYSGTVLIDGKTPYRLQRINGPQFENVTFNAAGIGFGDFVIGGRTAAAVFDYEVGDPLLSAAGHPEVFTDMVAVQSFQPHRMGRGNVWSFDLSLRSTRPVVGVTI